MLQKYNKYFFNAIFMEFVLTTTRVGHWDWDTGTVLLSHFGPEMGQKILCLHRETLVGAPPLAARRSLMCFSC